LPRNWKTIVSVVGSSTSIPFVDLPLPAIQAKIHGTSCILLIDNGAYQLCLSRELIERIGIASFPDGDHIFAGGTKGRASLCFVDELEVGQLTFMNVPATVLHEVGQISKRVRIDGVLGSDLMTDFAVEWNFSDNTIRFRLPNEHCKSGGPIKLRLLGSHFIVFKATIPPRADGLFYLDAGGTFSLALDKKHWHQLVRNDGRDVTHAHGVSGNNTSINYETIDGQTFVLGDRILDNIDVVGNIFPEKIKYLAHCDIIGIASSGVLKRFAHVSIDFKNLKAEFGAKRSVKSENG
jgi:hypothetical protein